MDGPQTIAAKARLWDALSMVSAGSAMGALKTGCTQESAETCARLFLTIPVVAQALKDNGYINVPDDKCAVWLMQQLVSCARDIDKGAVTP